MQPIHAGMLLLLILTICGIGWILYDKKINNNVNNVVVIFTMSSLMCLTVASFLSMILA